MVYVYPFSITPEEQRELRNCAKLLFNKINPYYQDETKEWFIKWKIYFDIFDIIIDVRYGNFLHLPFSGGAAEQPVKTMEVLKLLQHVFREKIDEENNRAAAKIKPPSIRRR